MMTVTRHLIHTLLLLSVMLTTAHAADSPRQYDIELLIFQNLGASDGGEVWPVDYSDWFDGDAPAPAAGGRPAWLDRSSLRMQAEQQALKRSANYRPLRHLAWRQTVVDRKRAQNIDIPLTGDDSAAKIVGTVRVAVERYLHLYLDLKMIDTSLARNVRFSDDRLPEFRLNQHRRMRSRELHYFDHPKFSVIALITPYTPSVPATVEQPAQ